MQAMTQAGHRTAGCRLAIGGQWPAWRSVGTVYLTGTSMPKPACTHSRLVGRGRPKPAGCRGRQPGAPAPAGATRGRLGQKWPAGQGGGCPQTAMGRHGYKLHYNRPAYRSAQVSQPHIASHSRPASRVQPAPISQPEDGQRAGGGLKEADMGRAEEFVGFKKN